MRGCAEMEAGTAENVLFVGINMRDSHVEQAVSTPAGCDACGQWARETVGQLLCQPRAFCYTTCLTKCASLDRPYLRSSMCCALLSNDNSGAATLDSHAGRGQVLRVDHSPARILRASESHSVCRLVQM